MLMTLVWAQCSNSTETFVPYDDIKKGENFMVGAPKSSSPMKFFFSSEETGLRIRWSKFTFHENFLEGKEALIVDEKTDPLKVLETRTVLEWKPIAKGHGKHKILARPDVTLHAIISQDFNSAYFKGLGSLTLEADPHRADLVKKIQIKSPNGGPISIHGGFSPHQAEVTFCSIEDNYDLYEEIKSGFDARNGFLIVGASQVTLTF